MIPVYENGRVVSNRAVSSQTWEMVVLSPAIANSAEAGQFAHVRTRDGYQPFLRRPLSIGPCDGDRLMLIFTVRGEGTRLLATKKAGDAINMIGPLGTGFHTPAEEETAVFVAGGIGIVPLLLLDDQIAGTVERRFLLGIRSKDMLSVSTGQIERREIELASDDGSMGFAGNVVELLSSTSSGFDRNRTRFYGCGPTPMMAALKDFCLASGLPLQISLEVPMGCGVGACQSCAVKLSDSVGYELVCRDGPVFDAKRVDLSPGCAP